MKNNSFIRFANVLVLFSLTLRLAYLHFHGGDGWVSFIKADIIINYGFITWYNGPASYFGWIGESYPVGNHLLISSIAIVTGLNLWLVFWILDIIISCFAVYSFIFLVKNLGFNKETILYSALCFLTSFVFLSVTTNNGTTRGLFLGLMPIVINLMIVSLTSTENRFKHYFLLTLLLIVLASTHRTFHFFWITFLIPYLLILITRLLFSIKILRQYLLKPDSKYYFPFLLLLYILGANQLIPVLDFGNNGIWGEREAHTNIILPNDNFIYVTLNLIATTSQNINPIVFFLPLGILCFPFKNLQSLNKFILYSTLFFISLFIFEMLYFPYVSLIIFSIFGGYGLYILQESNFQKKMSAVLSGGYFSIVLLSFFVYFSWIISRDFIFSIIISSFITPILIYYIYNLFKGIYHNDALVSFVVLLCISYSVTQTIDFSHLEDEQYHQGDGDLALQYRSDGSGFWFHEFGGTVMSYSGQHNHPVAVSGQKYAAMSLYITDNEVYNDQKETSFNLDTFFESGRKFFNVGNMNDRYVPGNAYALIWAGDQNLAQSYKVEYFIIDSDPSKIIYYQDGVFLNISLMDFLQEETYVIYENDYISFHFYSSY